jgi:hypothetical protein
MSSPVVVDLFVEDRAHEEFLKAMLVRLAHEREKEVTVRVRSARGGHGRALEELSLYQKSALKLLSGRTVPDLLVVAIDANCASFNKSRKDIEEKIDPPFKDRVIVACPDPHIERWYLADPDSFTQVVGVRPKVGKKKCERGRYKALLSNAIVDGGHPPTLWGIEFAREIVEEMDLYRAGKIEKSLKHFLDQATARLQTL